MINAWRHRLDLRRSNAATRHRNRYRERKSGQDRAEWLADVEAEFEVWEGYDDEGDP